MTKTASLSTQLLMPAPLVSGMAQTVLLVEWIVKQQQQLQTKQRLVEEQRQKIEALQKENEQLKDELDKLKNRSSSNSSVPPSSDQLKKPSDKSKRKKGKKRGPKYDHQGFEVEPWGKGQAPYTTDNCGCRQITRIEPALFPLRQFRDAEWIWSSRPSRRVETG